MTLRFLLFGGLFLLSVFWTSHPYAQASDEEMPPQSPTHVVGFTFHKLAGTEPDYAKWAEVYLKGKLNNYGEEGKKEKIRRTKAQFYTNFKNFKVWK